MNDGRYCYCALPCALADMKHPNITSLGQLTFVFYEEDGEYCAQCLELDFAGQGETREEASRDLRDCIDSFLEDYPTAPQEWSLEPAPPEYQQITDRERWQVFRVEGSEEGVRTVSTEFGTPPPDRFTPSLALA